MSHPLTVQLNDQTFDSIRRQAEAAGKSPAEFAGALLEERCNGKQKPADAWSDAEKQAANQRFRSLFGSIDLGHPLGIDNEQIDADLAREYGNLHGAH